MQKSNGTLKVWGWISPSSKVAFDVPPSALGKRLSIHFNELGFGTTHAFIELPSLEA
jgi:hypothetical protein